MSQHVTNSSLLFRFEFSHFPFGDWYLFRIPNLVRNLSSHSLVGAFWGTFVEAGRALSVPQTVSDGSDGNGLFNRRPFFSYDNLKGPFQFQKFFSCPHGLSAFQIQCQTMFILPLHNRLSSIIFCFTPLILINKKNFFMECHISASGVKYP